MYRKENRWTFCTRGPVKSANFTDISMGLLFQERDGTAIGRVGRAFYREDPGNTEVLIVGSHAYWPGEMQGRTRAKVEPSGLGFTI